MMAVDPITGKTLYGFEALKRRFIRFLTTQVSSRVKRRKYGNPALETLGKLQTPRTAMIVQNLTLEGLAEPQCGLVEFKAERCIAKASGNGFKVQVFGKWNGQALQLEGEL
ncbi:phage baseplate protein [Vibrio splendidus]|uniref:phage baseplate protein n=1 Tax=Vibrio splendidus TaxID=29497 RepID=UPI000C85E174|nr:phage baseplate protein [Vibrio splendidus]PMI49569.1 phage baseplate protein [Vibrio splendidus]